MCVHVCVRAPCGVISHHRLKCVTLKHHQVDSSSDICVFFLLLLFVVWFIFVRVHIFVSGELEVMLPIYGALKDRVVRGRLNSSQTERGGDTRALKAWGYFAYDSEGRY